MSVHRDAHQQHLFWRAARHRAARQLPGWRKDDHEPWKVRSDHTYERWPDLSRRSRLCVLSTSAEAPKIPADPLAWPRTVFKDLGNDARWTRGLPEHFSAARLQHLCH